MTIRRLTLILFLASISAWAQSGAIGSMRDPRSADSQAVGTHSIEPWLAVNGTYDTVLDKPETYGASVHRSVVLNGGLSAARDFHRTYFVFGYAGSGTDYLGSSAGIREGWTSSNVVTLAISSQVTQRVTRLFRGRRRR